MDFTEQLRAEAEKNEGNPRVLLEILREVLWWRGGPTHDLEMWIIDRITPHVEPQLFFPDTNAFLGDGSLDTDEWPERGLLREVGYTVRKGGPNKFERRILLTMVYEADAADHLPEEEARSWGLPRSRKRIQKMVKSLAHFVRHAKRRSDANLRQAIAKWEQDLQHLKTTFQEIHEETAWPNLSSDKHEDVEPPSLFG